MKYWMDSINGYETFLMNDIYMTLWRKAYERALKEGHRETSGRRMDDR